MGACNSCCACHNSCIDWQPEVKLSRVANSWSLFISRRKHSLSRACDSQDICLGRVDTKETAKWVPPVERCKVVSIYDGDTVTIIAFVNGSAFQFKCRLTGIDCAEIRGKSEGEKKAAREARDALKALILNKNVTLKKVGLEKYGRLLAEIWYRGRNINQWMIDQKYAVAYDGGKKKTIDWSTYRDTKV